MLYSSNSSSHSSSTSSTTGSAADAPDAKSTPQSTDGNYQPVITNPTRPITEVLEVVFDISSSMDCNFVEYDLLPFCFLFSSC